MHVIFSKRKKNVIKKIFMAAVALTCRGVVGVTVTPRGSASYRHIDKQTDRLTDGASNHVSGVLAAPLWTACSNCETGKKFLQVAM